MINNNTISGVYTLTNMFPNTWLQFDKAGIKK